MRDPDLARHGVQVDQLADPACQQFEKTFEASLVFQLEQEADIPLDIGLIVVPPRTFGTDAFVVTVTIGYSAAESVSSPERVRAINLCIISL